jgi:hypothetical protein
MNRRRLLQAFGAMCAAAAVPRATWALPAGSPGLVTLAQVDGEACFDLATFETMSAVAAFVVPGDDEFSVQQGVSTPEGGGVAAGAPQFLALALNQVLMDPTLIDLIWDRYGPDLEALPVPEGLVACAPTGSAIEQEGTVPLAPVIMLLINLLAVQAFPASVAGPYTVPFARLTWAEKAEVWRRFEALPDGFRPPDAPFELPIVSDAISLLDSLAGIIDYASGAILELCGLFTYAELLAFDREARILTHRPLGWELSNYLPGLLWPPDGWDELLGYYQGRRSVDA